MTDYKIIDQDQANKLIKKDTELEVLEYSYSTIYKIDNYFLVVPPLPYYSSIIIYDAKTLDNYKLNSHFPVQDLLDEFYILNKVLIDNFRASIDSLINEYNDILSKNYNMTGISISNINKYSDFIFKDKFKDKCKLIVIAIIGEYLRKKFETSKFDWALLKQIGGINPTFIPVLIDKKNKRYYEISNFVHNYFNLKFGELRDKSLNIIMDFPKRFREEEISFFVD